MDVVVPINYMAVFVAAVVSMIIGFIWYGPLFGKPWMKEMGLTKEKMEASKKKGMAKQYAILFVGSLFMAYVLHHATIFAGSYLHMTGAPAGLMSGFFNWLGFIAPVSLGSVLWEGKSWKLWLITNSYYVVSLMAMGVVVAVWM